jgi:CRISPR-associated protein Cas1
LAQYDLWRDATRSTECAKAIVAAKIANALAALRAWAESKDRLSAIAPAEEELRRMETAARSAATKEEAMGYEGNAARVYFGQWSALNASSYAWMGRNKNPPLDPPNALLSLAYTMLTRELGSLIEAEGLEPSLGCLHELDGSRPSLALDLVEAFRHPVADRLVWTLLERDVFAKDDFARHDGGAVLLSQTGMRRFLERYERWMLAKRRAGDRELPPFREALRREVRRFLLALREGKPFEPYRFETREIREGEEEPPVCDISSVTT